MKYQHCIFDLYGTLVDIHTDENNPKFWMALTFALAEAGAEYAGAELKRLYAKFVQQEQAKLTAEYPELQLDRVFRALLEEKGICVSKETIDRVGRQFRRLSREYVWLYPGAKELLMALRRAGKGVWLLTNAQRLLTMPELEALGIANLFDGIYISSDRGCKKPDPAFFRALLEEQHIDPATAIMIGNDGACDIDGAQKVGLHTLYIRSNLTPKEPLPKADHILTEMDLAKVQKILMG